MASMKDIALQRELDLLWAAAQSERERANVATRQLEEAVDEIAALQVHVERITTENDSLRREAAHSQLELQERTHHFQALLQRYRENVQAEHMQEALRVQEAASDAETKRLEAIQIRSTLLEEHNRLNEMVEQASRWTESMTSMAETETFKRVDAFQRLAVEEQLQRKRELSRIDRDVREWMTQSSSTMQEYQKGLRRAVDGVQQVLSTHLPSCRTQLDLHCQWHLEAFAEQYLQMTMAHCDFFCSSVASSTASRKGLASGDSSSLPLALISSSPSGPAIDATVLMQLEDQVASAERRLASRDQLIATLKRRAEAAEDQLAQSQEEHHEVQRQLRNLEPVVQTLQQTTSSQQNAISELRLELAMEKRRVAELVASQPPPLQPLLAVDGSGVIDPRSAQQHTTMFLREQLTKQMEILRKVEEGAEIAAITRAALLLEEAMMYALSHVRVGLLQERSEWLQWLSGRFEDERLTIRSHLIEAAEQVEDMERRKQTLEDIVRGSYSGGVQAASHFEMDRPFQLTSWGHLVQLSLPSPSPHLGGFGSLVSERGGTSSHWISPQQVKQMEGAIAALAALMMDVKMEFNSTLLQAQRSMLMTFWTLTPKERASSHVRMHILEGALSVTEAQRQQALTVAQWLEQQCLAARDGLVALLARTSDACDAAMTPTGAASSTTTTTSTQYSHEALVASELDRLKQGLQTSDRKAQRDAQFSRDQCDRLLHLLTSQQRRLVEAESQLLSATGDAGHCNARVDEIVHQMNYDSLTQMVEQEIADDSIACLRDMLNAERHMAKTCCSALTQGCIERNAFIGELEGEWQRQAVIARTSLMFGRYAALAFNELAEEYGDALHRTGRLVRVAALRSTSEVEHMMLTVHWEFGDSLVESSQSASLMFQEMQYAMKAVHDQNYYLRLEVTRTADSLSKLLDERVNERRGFAMLEEFVRDHFQSSATTMQRGMSDCIASMHRQLISYGKRYFNATRDFSALKDAIAGLQRSLLSKEEALDEHRVALASTSSAVASIETILGEKLAALRDAVIEIESNKRRQEEQDSLIKSLQEQLVVYHQLLLQAQQQKEMDDRRVSGLSGVVSEMKRVANISQTECTQLSEELEAERFAHRHTIEAITQAVTLNPRRQDEDGGNVV